MKLKRSGALWTVRYDGKDPFGGPVLQNFSAIEGVELLAEAYEAGIINYFSAHDDDLLDWDPNDPEDYLKPQSKIHEEIAKIKKIMDTKKMPMYMATCSLHGHPIFAAGGFTNRNPLVRELAIKKALRCGWIGNKLGAQTVTYWVARDGFEMPMTVNMEPGNSPYDWLKNALDAVSDSCIKNNYSIKKGTIEPKINEPRGAMYLPLVGSAIAFIDRLKNPDFWGVNPEIPQHSAMGNQSPFLEILQAAWMKKLTFLHVGGQIPGQFDDDFPVLVGLGKEGLIEIFYYLDKIGWNSVVEFDCHPMRTDLAVSIEARKGIFMHFLKHNSKTLDIIETVVERLKKDAKLNDALAKLNSFKPNQKLEDIKSNPQNHLAVDEAFNQALLNIQ